MRVIKRYPNRKLYDTSARQYVTLQAIRELVGQGESVQVLDSRTGKDVTKGALSKIVLEKEMENGGGLPTSFLTDMIKRSGRTVMGYLKKSWEAGKEAATWAEDEVGGSMKGLVKLGKISVAEAENLRNELASKVNARLTEQQKMIETGIRAGLEKALHAVNLPTRHDIDEMRSRLSKMESRLDTLLDGNGDGKKVRVKTKKG